MGIKFPFKFYHITDTSKETLYTVSKLDNGKVRIEWPTRYGLDFEEQCYTWSNAECFVNDGRWVVVEEKPKYIHDAIIRAWLDGEQIQCRLKDPYSGDPLSDWFDLSESADSITGDIPGFNIKNEYRIKPKIEQVSFTLAELFYDDTLKDKLSNTHLKLTANIEDGKVISISVK